MFSWTRGMWILKPCSEFFRSKSENFFLKLQKILKIYQFFKRFSEIIPWTLRLMFWKPCRKCFAKVRNFSTQGAKITENQSFFSKKNPQSLHLDSPNAVLTPLGEGFFPKTKNILVKVLRRLKNHKFSQKELLNLFLWTSKLRFRKPYSKLFVERQKKFPPNDQNCSLKAEKLQ